EIRDTADGATERVASGGLFMFIGADAQTGWVPAQSTPGARGCRLTRPRVIAPDARASVLTGPEMRAAGQWGQDRDPYLLETSVPGIFACGDVRFGPVKRVASAVRGGRLALAVVHQCVP